MQSALEFIQTNSCRRNGSTETNFLFKHPVKSSILMGVIINKVTPSHSVVSKIDREPNYLNITFLES